VDEDSRADSSWAQLARRDHIFEAPDADAQRRRRFFFVDKDFFWHVQYIARVCRLANSLSICRHASSQLIENTSQKNAIFFLTCFLGMVTFPLTFLQSGISYRVIFIESRQFTRRLAELAGDSAGDVLAKIQAELLQNPVRGPLVQGLGGIRKARAANPGRGKGKRGGLRYLYLVLENRRHIHLLFLLDKGEQEDLNADERKALRGMVEELKDYGR
jgi:hypothetical protein